MELNNLPISRAICSECKQIGIIEIETVEDGVAMRYCTRCARGIFELENLDTFKTEKPSKKGINIPTKTGRSRENGWMN